MSDDSVKSFKVFSASAGAGKTFNLVKSYLALCLRSENSEEFKRILAITFTVKAANEMKHRVLGALDAFRKVPVVAGYKSMFDAISNELKLDESTLQRRSEKVLKSMLHDYSGLSISTIDKFTYRIVRTFSHDLGLGSHFEIELDEKELYRQSVDLLLDDAGSDKALSALLERYIEDNMEEGRSWKPERKIADMAEHIGKEGSYEQVSKLKDISLDEFKAIRQRLVARRREIGSLKEVLIKEGDDLIGHIPKAYFSRGSVGIYLESLKGRDAKKYGMNKTLRGQIEKGSFLVAKPLPEASAAIEPITPQIVDWLEKCLNWVEKDFAELRMISEVLKNFDATAVLREVSLKLKELKEANNIETLKTFNQLIHETLVRLPVPYIYERIGEKYKHYFIDEFQDTSELQWSNLKPLVHNAIASGGSSLIVGDAKQSIYRWRGGKADQFIDLVEDAQNPSQSELEWAYALQHISLDNNWRSGSEIVNFNNRFFTHFASVFESESFQSLYESSSQKAQSFEGGFVSLEFLEYPHQKKDVFDEAQISRITEIVKENLADKYRPGDIAILVRSGAEGESVAEALSKENINVVSSDSLKLGNSSAVRLLVAFIRHLHYPQDEEARLDIAEYLVQTGRLESSPSNLHQALQVAADKNTEGFTQWLKSLEIDPAAMMEQNAGLYELGETVARNVGLLNGRKADPFVQFFLDEMYEFGASKNQGVHDFLEWWLERGHEKSITAPESKDAVQILTIHKAKGLEYPVCIVPFVYRPANAERKGRRWITFEDHRMMGLPVVEVGMSDELNKDVAVAYPEYHQAFEAYQHEARFDNMNLLYVAFTRPEERLYILSKDERDESKLPEHKRLSQYLGTFAIEMGSSCQAGSRCVFGQKSEPRYLSKNETEISNTVEFSEFESAPWRNRVRLSRDLDGISDQLTEQPRKWGNAVHALLARVNKAEDIDSALRTSILKGELPADKQEEMGGMLSEIVNHPALAVAFQADEVYSERDWLGGGEVHRPDRIAKKGDTWYVIDYKTGEPHKRYEKQVHEYARLLRVPMEDVQMYLVYINEEVEVQRVR